jgi:hypothetical protein
VHGTQRPDEQEEGVASLGVTDAQAFIGLRLRRNVCELGRRLAPSGVSHPVIRGKGFVTRVA